MMNDETRRLGMRILQGSSSSYSRMFNPTVYWITNSFLIAISVLFLLFCFYRGCMSSGNSSGQVYTYRERLRQQGLQQEQAKKEPPEERRAKLLESFHRNKVHSTVQDDDFVEESLAENVENVGAGEAHDEALNAMEMGTQVLNETAMHNLETSTAEEEHEYSLNAVATCSNECTVQTLENSATQDQHDQAMNDVETCEHDANESMVENTTHAAVSSLENEAAPEDEQNVTVTMYQVELHEETGEPGYIKLRTPSGIRMVPNCCAVCLSTYKPGESIVWSYTKECPHVFHEECVVEWLIKKQNGTPCPCCRQEFTDLSLYNESQKLADTPQSSFDVGDTSL